LRADVVGFSLPAPTAPSLFEAAGLVNGIEHYEGDIRDYAALLSAMRDAAPDVVIHMAAQSLVLDGLHDPVGTFATNVQGTVHVLEAIKNVPSIRAAVIVTSDKCYEPAARPLRERDPLGGHDPYSGSKACAEIAVQSYRESFFRSNGPVLACVRAGNVIGGGDWSNHRIVADLARAMQADRRITLRHPKAIRPWQHVADALCGYLAVADRALEGDRSMARAWNFGPDKDAHVTVEALVSRFATAYGQPVDISVESAAAAENPVLMLDSSAARDVLGWRPKFDIDDTVYETADFYRRLADGEPAQTLLSEQIRRFIETEPVAV